MKVYGYPNARSARVVWTLEEIGLGYEYIKVDLAKGEGFKPPYRELNPGGKVPTLVDGDRVLTESAAICTYLGDRFPACALAPAAGTWERALYDQWCYFVLSELEQPLWTIAKHRFALPEKWRVPAVIETAGWEFSVATQVLSRGLKGREFIVGDRFTVADLLIAHTLDWARRFELPIEDEHVNGYAARLLARPALARARAREQSA